MREYKQKHWLRYNYEQTISLCRQDQERILLKGLHYAACAVLRQTQQRCLHIQLILHTPTIKSFKFFSILYKLRDIIAFIMTNVQYL